MKATTIGIDLAKHLFQLYGVDQHGKTNFNWDTHLLDQATIRLLAGTIRVNAFELMPAKVG